MPECSRLANQPGSYGILTDHNAGANVELARIARRAQDGIPHIYSVLGGPPKKEQSIQSIFRTLL